MSSEESSLQPHQHQVHKCIQLYNTLLIRHGVMLLGPTGGGKTTVINLLKKALNTAHGDYYGQMKDVFGGISLSASLSLTGSISEVHINCLFHAVVYYIDNCIDTCPSHITAIEMPFHTLSNKNYQPQMFVPWGAVWTL